MSIKIPDGGESEPIEAVDEVADYLDEVIESARFDAFIGGFALALFMFLPPGMREVAGVFAALAGVELGDTHRRNKVPVDLIREGPPAAIGFAVGAGIVYVAPYLGFL